MHAVMKGAALGRQRRQRWCGSCHFRTGFGRMRVGSSRVYCQPRTNYHSDKYRFRHDRTHRRGAGPQAVFRRSLEFAIRCGPSGLMVR